MPMTVEQARRIARDWITRHVAGTPGVIGAVFHGSINWLPDDAELTPGSDVDVLVVVAEGTNWVKPGKFTVDGVLLEVSDLPASQVASGEQVLGAYSLAGSFRDPVVLLDPTGHLAEVAAIVSARYADEHQVRRRMADARGRVEGGFGIQSGAPFADQVIHWVFPAAVTTHIVLVAGLRNPTVRKRYVAVRELLAGAGLSDRYGLFTRLIGADHLDYSGIAAWMDGVEAAFTDAVKVIHSTFPFAADISEAGWPVAIGGSRDLITAGDAREALFWMIVTWSRCMAVLASDGTPDLFSRHDLPYREFMSALGIETEADLRERHDETLAALPDVWSIAESVLAGCPGVRR